MCYCHLLLTCLTKVLAMILMKGRILCLPLQYNEVCTQAHFEVEVENDCICSLISGKRKGREGKELCQ